MPDSCVPACLRLVLASYGIELTEAELRELCDCTFFGTDAFAAVQAARQLGFSQTSKTNLTMGEVKALADDQQWPIVYVGLRPLEGKTGIHALVVLNVSDTAVVVLDPAKGERIIPRAVFEDAWKLQLGLTILLAQ
jgi:ABC-type bacteriocin/lantibiotic exporter with double-glycine peptidase domain